MPAQVVERSRRRRSRFSPSAGDAVGVRLAGTRAATPATCGVAIDVPLIVLVAVSLVAHADVMLEPGAKMSTTLPKFENDDAGVGARASEPTVIAAATRAGDELHAFAFELPAAIAYVTPDAIELRTAVSSAVDTPPPRLMFATPRARCGVAVTQSTPAMTPEFDPEPWQLSTRTATSRDRLRDAVGRSADGADDVRAVAVAVVAVRARRRPRRTRRRAARRTRCA